jgi:hypothetical protein
MKWKYDDPDDPIPYCKPVYSIRDRVKHLYWAFIVGIISGTGANLAPWVWGQVSSWLSKL